MKTGPIKTVQYLDALKEKLGVKSDYAVAKALQVTTATMSNYRRHGGTFDYSIAKRVAVLLEVDPLDVLADVELERGARLKKIPTEVLLRMAKKLIASVGAVLIAAGLGALPSPAEASAPRPGNTVYYVKRGRRLVRAAATALAAIARTLAYPQTLLAAP